MACVIVFPITAQVTASVINDLNRNCYTDFEPVFVSSFNPARRDVKDTAISSQEAIDLTVDHFEGAIGTELQDLFVTNYRPLNGGDNFTSPSTFAVLDERGVRDRTILIFTEDGSLDEDDEPTEQTIWRSWRVRWADAYDMVIQLEGGAMEIIDGVLVDLKDDFTDAAGVFDYSRAMRENGYKE